MDDAFKKAQKPWAKLYEKVNIYILVLQCTGTTNFRLIIRKLHFYTLKKVTVSNMYPLNISGEEGESRVPQCLQDREVLHQPREERGGRLDNIAGHGKTDATDRQTANSSFNFIRDFPLRCFGVVSSASSYLLYNRRSLPSFTSSKSLKPALLWLHTY